MWRSAISGQVRVQVLVQIFHCLTLLRISKRRTPQAFNPTQHSPKTSNENTTDKPTFWALSAFQVGKLHSGEDNLLRSVQQLWSSVIVYVSSIPRSYNFAKNISTSSKRSRVQFGSCFGFYFFLCANTTAVSTRRVVVTKYPARNNFQTLTLEVSLIFLQISSVCVSFLLFPCIYYRITIFATQF